MVRGVGMVLGGEEESAGQGVNVLMSNVASEAHRRYVRTVNHQQFSTYLKIKSATVVNSYISTSSTTSTLRLPLYILSAVDAYQKAYGTGKNVMMMVMVLQGTYVL